MSNIWNVIFDEYVSTPYDSGSLKDKLDEIDKEKRRKEFDQALMNLFFSGDDLTAGPKLLRNLVESTDLLVPVNDDGSLKVRQAAPAAYRLAIGEQKNSNGKKSGRGGRLLPVHAEHPTERMSPKSKASSKKTVNGTSDSSNQKNEEFDGQQSIALRQISGVELVRSISDIASGIDGLLFYQKGNPPLELGRDHFGELESLVVATELEAVLAVPGPDQIEPLLQAQFLINMLRGDAETDGGCRFDSRLLVAYTHKDKLSSFGDSSGVVPINGEELFRMLAENESYDGLLVNPTSKVGAGAQCIHRLILSPGFAYNILRGRDIRPGVAPLPARSYEEIKLWLSLAGFPSKSRKLIDAPLPDSILVRATVPDDAAWTMEETDGSKDTRHGPPLSPVFSLPLTVAPQAEAESWSVFPGQDKSEYGKGPTLILCAGMIATHLNPRWNSNPKNHNFGKWLLLGRYMDDYSRRDARQRLALARELWKLLPPGADRIPRSALLTVEGAAYLREYPIGGTRQWIESTIAHTERATRTWMWGW